jgi:hypothetical protein
MNKITVAYAPDVNMLPLTLVSMASVLQNAKKTDEIEFSCAVKNTILMLK